jgi:Protein of unknown function (DUF2783)
MTTQSFGGSPPRPLPPSPPESQGSLDTQPNISAHDDFYHDLIDMHRDLSARQSALVNAKLILLLANHIGDLAVLREAMRAARHEIEPELDTDVEEDRS